MKAISHVHDFLRRNFFKSNVHICEFSQITRKMSLTVFYTKTKQFQYFIFTQYRITTLEGTPILLGTETEVLKTLFSFTPAKYFFLMFRRMRWGSERVSSLQFTQKVRNRAKIWIQAFLIIKHILVATLPYDNSNFPTVITTCIFQVRWRFHNKGLTL